MNEKPRIISYDLEVSPGLYRCYGNIWELIVVEIVEFEQILAMSYQIVGEDKIRYIGQNTLPGYIPGINDDKELVKEIVKILNNCDYRAGQNIDAYDEKMVQQRAMFHRLPALEVVPTFDTKKLYKGIARLPSNKLDHIVLFMRGGGKIDHNGTNLFTACAKGDPKAWALNRKYNMHDVRITSQILEDVLPYAKLTKAQQAYSCDIQCQNPNCLSYNLMTHKKRKVKGGWRQQLQCRDCGSYTTNPKLIK